MTNDNLNKIHNYLNAFVNSRNNEFPRRNDAPELSWETLMSLLACIENTYPAIEFHIDRNHFQIEQFKGDEQIITGDKAPTLKEAVVQACFRFLSGKNKDAPDVELPNDNFLLDEE